MRFFMIVVVGTLICTSAYGEKKLTPDELTKRVLEKWQAEKNIQKPSLTAQVLQNQESRDVLLLNFYDELTKQELREYIVTADARREEIFKSLVTCAEKLQKEMDGEEFWARQIVSNFQNARLGQDSSGSGIDSNTAIGLIGASMRRQIDLLNEAIGLLGRYIKITEDFSAQMAKKSFEQHNQLVTVLRCLTEQKESRPYVQKAVVATKAEGLATLIGLTVK